MRFQLNYDARRVVMSEEIDYLKIPEGVKVPEPFYQRYCELVKGTNYLSKKKNFYNIFMALLSIAKQRKSNYDYAEIIRVIKAAKGSGPSYTTIINKTGEEYQELIGLFVQYVAVTTEKTTAEPEDDRLLLFVSDRQARLRIREKLVLVRSLTNQLNIAKQQVANNSPPILLAASQNSPLALPGLSSQSLTFSEYYAIEDFLKKYEKLGFFENNLGALMEPGGMHEFAPVGFLSALRKVVDIK